MVRDEASH
jgi:G protein-coupled receptor kinase